VTRTFINDDGVLVVDAGPVVLESTTDLGEPEVPQKEEDDVVRPGAGE
jgi:hypothetical protein